MGIPKPLTLDTGGRLYSKHATWLWLVALPSLATQPRPTISSLGRKQVGGGGIYHRIATHQMSLWIYLCSSWEILNKVLSLDHLVRNFFSNWWPGRGPSSGRSLGTKQKQKPLPGQKDVLLATNGTVRFAKPQILSVATTHYKGQRKITDGLINLTVVIIAHHSKTSSVLSIKSYRLRSNKGDR